MKTMTTLGEVRYLAQKTVEELKELYSEEYSEDERREREEDGLPCDLYEYVTGDDVLDVEYTLDSSKRLIGVSLCIACGGPSGWIDTRRREVTFTWGTDRGFFPLPDEVADEINSVFDDFNDFTR